RVRVEHDVDDRRLARPERALQRGGELVGSLDMLAMASERLGQAVVARRSETGRNLGLVAVDPDLWNPDLAPRSVVSDHERDGDPEPRQRLELEPVEPERSVAGDDDDLLRRLGGLDSERVRRTDAQTAERPRIEPVARPVHAQYP